MDDQHAVACPDCKADPGQICVQGRWDGITRPVRPWVHVARLAGPCAPAAEPCENCNDTGVVSHLEPDDDEECEHPQRSSEAQFVPLFPGLYVPNGGQVCDMAVGACACGATHLASENRPRAPRTGEANPAAVCVDCDQVSANGCYYCAACEHANVGAAKENAANRLTAAVEKERVYVRQLEADYAKQASELRARRSEAAKTGVEYYAVPAIPINEDDQAVVDELVAKATAGMKTRKLATAEAAAVLMIEGDKPTNPSSWRAVGPWRADYKRAVTDRRRESATQAAFDEGHAAGYGARVIDEAIEPRSAEAWRCRDCGMAREIDCECALRRERDQSNAAKAVQGGSSRVLPGLPSTTSDGGLYAVAGSTSDVDGVLRKTGSAVRADAESQVLPISSDVIATVDRDKLRRLLYGALATDYENHQKSWRDIGEEMLRNLDAHGSPSAPLVPTRPDLVDFRDRHLLCTQGPMGSSPGIYRIYKHDSACLNQYEDAFTLQGPETRNASQSVSAVEQEDSCSEPLPMPSRRSSGSSSSGSSSVTSSRAARNACDTCKAVRDGWLSSCRDHGVAGPSSSADPDDDAAWCERWARTFSSCAYSEEDDHLRDMVEEMRAAQFTSPAKEKP